MQFNNCIIEIVMSNEKGGAEIHDKCGDRDCLESNVSLASGEEEIIVIDYRWSHSQPAPRNNCRISIVKNPADNEEEFIYLFTYYL